MFLKVIIADIPFYLNKSTREFYMSAFDYERLTNFNIRDRIKPMSFILDFQGMKLFHFKFALIWAKNDCQPLASRLSEIDLTSRDESEVEVELALTLAEKQRLEKLVNKLEKKIERFENKIAKEIKEDSREKFLNDFFNVVMKACKKKQKYSVRSSDLVSFSILRRKDGLIFFGIKGKSVLNKPQILKIFDELDSLGFGSFDNYLGTFSPRLELE